MDLVHANPVSMVNTVIISVLLALMATYAARTARVRMVPFVHRLMDHVIVHLAGRVIIVLSRALDFDMARTVNQCVFAIMELPVIQ
jgi:hypothetical protein